MMMVRRVDKITHPQYASCVGTHVPGEQGAERKCADMGVYRGRTDTEREALRFRERRRARDALGCIPSNAEGLPTAERPQGEGWDRGVCGRLFARVFVRRRTAPRKKRRTASAYA